MKYEKSAYDMKVRQRQTEQTRTAILEALAAEITESGMLDFSIQAVADRAGVTHRTVYNHFPTREELNDAFAEYVEEVLSEHAIEPARRDVASWPKIAREAHEMMGGHASHLISAYVMMTIATGMPARVFRTRSKRMEKAVDDELGPLEPGVAKLVTSAIRMFVSSAGWFLMNAHHGLTPAEAGRVSEWAVKTLLDAVRSGDVPERSEKENKDG